jgi:nucleoside-diphosphate-sugar epimerase
MKVAITGGTGFVGRRLAHRHLAMGDAVRVLTRRPKGALSIPEGVQLFQGDLSVDAGALPAFVDGVDVLYHCAGEIRDEARMHSTHVNGTKHLIDAAKGRVGKWVQLSSVGVYGPKRTGVVTEATPHNASGPYETTKLQSDLLLLKAAEHEALRCVVLRPSIVFGEDMLNRSLFQMIAMIERGLFFFVGKPGASANYVHAENVIEALVRCGTRETGFSAIYNLSDCSTMEHFVSCIAAGLGRSTPALRLPEGMVRAMARIAALVPGSPLTMARVDALTNRAVYSRERIEMELEYSPVISMDEGLGRVVQAWKRSA